MDLDGDDQNDDVFAIGKKVRIDIADMDYKSWRRELERDKEILDLLLAMIADITPAHDSKLQTLFDVIDEKQEHPINTGNKKIIIFTAFADTANYLYDTVSVYVKKKYGLDTAIITGSVDGKTTIKGLKTDLNTVLTCFSPISKGKSLLLPNEKAEIDILIATDCISEGQNLQDCDYLINYDIHWNPVRIIQRFGRIDRIGSKNECIQLVNFWPNITLDEYINLKARVETRMKIVDMTATGDDNVLSPEEKGDLEYRKQQLKRLQEEVVDIEDMSSGISIMDLGLNEFRLDLLDYIKTHPEIEKAPHGMNAVVKKTEELPAGVIFVLRNIKNEVNINSQNRLHPFYMVYMSEEGEVIIDHLSPKEMLDSFRLLCKGKKEPDKELCAKFNDETDDGRKMGKYSDLLGNAIASIIELKDESDIDNFLGGSQVTVDKAIYTQRFDVVIFDEASMAYVPQVIFAAGIAKNYFVCLGDFCQLPAIVQNKVDDRLTKDIFEHTGIISAVENNEGHNWLVMLDLQYRMHLEIADFVSENMYQGRLKTFNKIMESRNEIAALSPCRNEAMTLMDLSGMYSICTKTKDNSRINLLSAMMSMRLAEKYIGNYEVGIVTPYSAQSRLIVAMLRDIQAIDKRWEKVSCATVHQFQGSEKPVIIYDAVDCYRMPYPGTLLTSLKNDTANRLFNVAVTRAKGKFILIANVDYLLKKKISKNLIFTKAINMMRQSNKLEKGFEILDELMPELNEKPSIYLEDRETSWETFISDIEAAKKIIHIDMPDIMDDSDGRISQLSKILNEQYEKNVEICIRHSEEIDLPNDLQKFQKIFEYVTTPVTIIDKSIIWFGQPLYAADFISEGEILDTEYFPCMRFEGKYSARLLQAFLEM